MKQTQFLVDLQRENFSFQCAFLQVSAKGLMEITGRGINLRVTVLAQPNHLNGPYVVDFSMIKRTVEQLCKRHTEKVLLASHSPDFQTAISDTAVTVHRGSNTFVVPRSEVVLVPLETITPATLAKYLNQSLVEMMGSEWLQQNGVQSLTLHVDNGEYSVGYEHHLPIARL